MSVEIYFSTKHEDLKSGYLWNGGPFHDNCLSIAVKLRKLLEAEGRLAHLDRIMTPENAQLVREKQTLDLIPSVYEGRVSWIAHVVCHEDAADLVHDPMLDRPMLMAEYLDTAFSQAVVISRI